MTSEIKNGFKKMLRKIKGKDDNGNDYFQNISYWTSSHTVEMDNEEVNTLHEWSKDKHDSFEVTEDEYNTLVSANAIVKDATYFIKDKNIEFNASNILYNDSSTNLGASNVQSAIEKIVNMSIKSYYDAKSATVEEAYTSYDLSEVEVQEKGVYLFFVNYAINAKKNDEKYMCSLTKNHQTSAYLQQTGITINETGYQTSELLSSVIELDPGDTITCLYQTNYLSESYRVDCGLRLYKIADSRIIM